MKKKFPPPPPTNLFVKSKIREYIKKQGLNTSSGLLDGNMLNDAIKAMLDKAISRAKNNGRKTVRSVDL